MFGIEADLAYRPADVDGLTLKAAVNWNDAKYTELDNVPCYGGQTIAAGCNRLFDPTKNGGTGGFTAQDRSDTPLIRAPKWALNFGFTWELPAGNGKTVVLGNNHELSSSYVTNLGYVTYQDPFFKTDLSVALKGREDKWEVALIGKNLTNALTTGNCSNSNRAGGLLGGQITGANGTGAAGIDEIGCYTDGGREIWIRLGLHFR